MFYMVVLKRCDLLQEDHRFELESSICNVRIKYQLTDTIVSPLNTISNERFSILLDMGKTAKVAKFVVISLGLGTGH